MNSNDILKADLLDILFDNRNKQYGAYTLRKNYNHRLEIALGISLSATLLLFFVLPKNHRSVSVSNINDGVIVHSIEVPKEIKKLPPPPQKAQVQIRQQRFQTPILVNRDIVPPPPNMQELQTSVISNKTIDGGLDKGSLIPTTPVVAQPTVAESKPKTEFKPDQKEPEFPGGQEAWLNFLRKNLIAPEELESGEKKTVEIRFIVATDGSVTGLEVVQSAGRDFDNEVIRVLKKMPKWKPAVQNGQAVAKSYTQPVTFIGVEQ